MLEFEFAINNRVEIIWEDGAYKCHVQDLGEDFIAINIPAKEGKYLPLKVGEMVEVVYYEDKDAYQFYTTVIGRKIDRIALILLRMPEKIEKIQRRNSVRISCIEDISYIRIKENTTLEQMQKLEEEREAFKSAILVDVSGGGIKFKTTENLKAQDYIMAFLPLGFAEVVIKGKVIRVEKEEDGKRNVCGVRFVDIEKKDTEKIMKYIFKVMREQRRKGLKEE